MRRLIWALSVAVGLGLVGCTKSKPTPVAAAAPAQNAAAVSAAHPAPQPIHVPASATPEQVMAVFLRAWQQGDSATFESLLTTKAREELAKHDMVPDPLSSPEAVFQVQQAQLFPGELANVNSVWTEQFKNDQGGPPVQERYEIVWALRHQSDGWRVAGMQMELTPGQPQHISFEDGAKMAAIMAQANTPPAQGTQQPAAATPGSPITQPPQGPQTGPIQTAQQPQLPPTQAVPQRIER
jgi:hypothetical protein